MLKKPLYFICALCLMMISCKPTEKGYQAAYDAAKGKREALKQDVDVNIAKGPLQQVDGPQIKVVEGEEVYVMNKRLTPADFVMELPERYNVAIGTYKMITNCKAQAEMLLSDGYHAFPAKDSEGMYFTIAGSFPTLKDAVNFYKEYKSGSGRVYVGLPDSPVIIYSPK